MNIKKELHRLNIEDIIWIIYLFIILFSLYSNYLYRKYLLHNNSNAKKFSQKLDIIIAIIIFFVYIYFLKIAYEDLENNKNKSWQNKTYKKDFISFIGAFLFLIAGSITIYSSISTTSQDEIGFI